MDGGLNTIMKKVQIKQRDWDKKMRKINRKLSTYPHGVIVDIPIQCVWDNLALMHVHFSTRRSGGWIDDEVELKSFTEGYEVMSRVREHYGDEVVAVGLHETRVAEEPTPVGRTRRTFVKKTTIRFVLPDEHEATMFKLRWG